MKSDRLLPRHKGIPTALSLCRLFEASAAQKPKTCFRRGCFLFANLPRHWREGESKEVLS